MKAFRGSEVHLHPLFTSVLDRGEWPTSLPGRFTLLKEPRYELVVALPPLKEQRTPVGIGCRFTPLKEPRYELAVALPP